MAGPLKRRGPGKTSPLSLPLDGRGSLTGSITICREPPPGHVFVGSLAEIDPRKVAEVVRRSRHKKTTPLQPIFPLSPKPIARFRWKRARLSLFRPQPHLPSFIQMHPSFADLLAKTTFQIVTIIGETNCLTNRDSFVLSASLCYTVMFISSFSHVRLSLDNKRLLTYLLITFFNIVSGCRYGSNEDTVQQMRMVVYVDVFEQHCCHIDCHKLPECKYALSQDCQSSSVECATGTSSSRIITIKKLLLYRPTDTLQPPRWPLERFFSNISVNS